MAANKLDKYGIDRFKKIAEAISAEKRLTINNMLKNPKREWDENTLQDTLLVLNRLATETVTPKRANSWNPLTFIPNLMSATGEWLTTTGDKNLDVERNKIKYALFELNPERYPEYNPRIRSFFARYIGDPIIKNLQAWFEYPLLSMKANYYGVPGYGSPTLFIKFLRSLFQFNIEEPTDTSNEKIKEEQDTQERQVHSTFHKELHKILHKCERSLNEAEAVEEIGKLLDETKKLLGKDKDGKDKKVDLDQLIPDSFSTSTAWTGLAFAVDRGWVKIATFLCENGANPNNQIHENPNIDSKTRSKHTPLIRAVETGNFDMLKALVDGGANVTQADRVKHYAYPRHTPEAEKYENGITPIIMAVQRGDSKAIEYLLDKGANPFTPDNLGNNAIIHVIREEKYDLMPTILKHIREKGGNQYKDFSDNDLLMCYILCGEKVEVESLLKKINIIDFPHSRYGNTPLGLAVQVGNIELIKLLLAKGEDMHAPLDGGTPFEQAIQTGNPDIMDPFFKMGVNPDLKLSGGRTPIMIAIKSYPQDAKGIKFILTQKPELSAEDNQGRTPLMLAIETSRIDEKLREEIVNLLIDSSNVNHVDKTGRRPITLATTENGRKFIPLLLQKGATVNFTLGNVENGQPYLMWFLSHIDYHDWVKELFLEVIQANGTDLTCGGRGSILLEVIRHYSERLIPKVLTTETGLGLIQSIITIAADKKIDLINLEDKDGTTPLIKAIKEKRLEIVELLLKNNANINHRNKDGKTAIMFAIESGNEGTIKLLRASGADESLVGAPEQTIGTPKSSRPTN